MKQILDNWKFIITIILSVGAIIYAEGRRAERQELQYESMQSAVTKMQNKVDTVFEMVNDYQSNFTRIERRQIEFGIDLYYLQDSYKQYLKLREKDVEVYSKLTDGLHTLENDVRSRYNIQKIITPIK